MNARDHWCVSPWVCRLRGSCCVPAYGVCMRVCTRGLPCTCMCAPMPAYLGTQALLRTREDVKMSGCVSQSRAGLGLVAAPAGRGTALSPRRPEGCGWAGG